MFTKPFRSFLLTVALAATALAAACGPLEMADEPPSEGEALMSHRPEAESDEAAAAEDAPADLELDPYSNLYGQCGSVLCNRITHTCCNRQCLRRVPGQLCGGSPGEGSSQ